MSDRIHYVYALTDINDTVFYIGAGKGDRLNDHVKYARKYYEKYPHSAKCKYVFDCVERGYPPNAVIIEDGLTIEEAAKLEITLIKRYRRRDVDEYNGLLLNACDGGFGIKNVSKYSKGVISEKTAEALARPETKAKLLAATKKRWENEENRKTISESVKALWATDDDRAAFTSKNKEKWTPERRAKQAERTRRQLAESGNPFKGKAHSEETKQKLRDASNKYWTDEKRADAANRMKGKKLSEETKSKISEAFRVKREKRKENASGNINQ